MSNFEEIIIDKVKEKVTNGVNKNNNEKLFNLKAPSLKNTILLNILFVFILVIGYIYQPVAINIKNGNIYVFTAIMLIILYVINAHFFINKLKKVIYALLLPLVILFGVGGFFQIQTWAIWDNGNQYYNQIGKVENLNSKQSSKFSFDLNKNYIVNKEMALRIADKKMGVGSLSSQYKIGDATLQKIKYNNKQKLFWVINLEYNNFWSQFSNGQISNVILVDANKPQDAAILLDKNAKNQKFQIKLAKTGLLNQNLNRMVQLSNPFKMLTDYSFELDDDLTPHYIVTTYKNARGFSLPIVTGVIDINLQSGKMLTYDKKSVPNWIDRVNPVSLVQSQITNHGSLVHGVFNFSNKDKFELSNDEENFIYLDNEPYFISGITSPSSDKSLVGIIAKSLKEDKSYRINLDGAVESSAMKSAEGKVQNYGYKAISPIIIHSARWKYLVPLVDNESLIKTFALVDIQNYQNVQIYDTIEEFVSGEAKQNQIVDQKQIKSTKEKLEEQIKLIETQLSELKKNISEVKN